MDTTKKRSGRPKKAEADKVKYQLIAVYRHDYERFVEVISKKGIKRVDAFSEMVASYDKE